MNQGGHAEPEIFGLLDVPDNYIFDHLHRWVDFYLKGIDSGIVDEPPVQMESGNTVFSGKYAPYQGWPIHGAVNMAPFRLTERGDRMFGGLHPSSSSSSSSLRRRDSEDTEKKQLLLPPKKPLSSVIMSGGGADTIHYSELCGLAVGTIVSDYVSPLGIPFDSELAAAPRDSSIVFRSEPLSKTTLYCGMPPLINITVTPSSSNWQLYAFLYDVDELLDIGRLISFNAYTVHDGVANKPFRLENWELRTMCTEIPAGHRIAVGFTMYNYLWLPAEKSGSVSFDYQDATLAMPANPN